MLKHYLKKVMLIGSIALGTTASASIPFGAKVFFDDKQNNSTIQKPGNGSIDDDKPNNGGDIPDNGGDNGGDNNTGENGDNNENDNHEKKIEITRQPLNVEVFPKETATLTFEYKVYNLSQSDSINIQWYKDGNLLNGKTSQTLIINNVDYTDVGEYYACINIGNYLSVKSNKASLKVKNDSSQYDSIVFADGTPIVEYYNWVENPALRIELLVQFSKNGTLTFNGENIKVDIYLGDLLVETMFTGPDYNRLYSFIECDRSDFEGKEIRFIASYGKLVREYKVTKVDIIGG